MSILMIPEMARLLDQDRLITNGMGRESVAK